MPTNTLEMKVTDVHRTTYRDNVQMRAQQKKSRMRSAVTEMSVTGEMVNAADLVGEVEAVRRPGRSRTNIDNPPTNERRWLYRRDPIESGQYIDKVEKLDRAMDPTSIYTTTHTNAVIRGIDDVYLGVEKGADGIWRVGEGGVMGAAGEGKRGTVKKALPSVCHTPHGSSGLTTEKLRAALKRMRFDEFGMDEDDELYAAIGPEQIDDLLVIAEQSGTGLTQSDKEEMKSGRPKMLLGVSWIWMNRLPFNAANDARMIPIWSKKNIAAGVWQDVDGDMWNDGHAKNTPYCHVDAIVDAVRVEDLGVHVIECAETPR
jgi:hypothetical protein